MSNNKYIQLCYDERIVIENRLKNGESYNAIAKSLGRSTSTISREVNSFIEEQIQRLPGRKQENPPARKQGGGGWRVDRDAGEPAHRNHASTRRVELVFRFTSFHRLDDKGF